MGIKSSKHYVKHQGHVLQLQELQQRNGTHMQQMALGYLLRQSRRPLVRSSCRVWEGQGQNRQQHWAVSRRQSGRRWRPARLLP